MHMAWAGGDSTGCAALRPPQRQRTGCQRSREGGPHAGEGWAGGSLGPDSGTQVTCGFQIRALALDSPEFKCQPQCCVTWRTFSAFLCLNCFIQEKS